MFQAFLRQANANISTTARTAWERTPWSHASGVDSWLDRPQWANTTIVFARQLYNMLQLARVIAQGAVLRDESRGAHYKPDFPERDDKNWLKTTKASFAPDADEPKFEFEPVDISLIPPRQRRYDVAK